MIFIFQSCSELEEDTSGLLLLSELSGESDVEAALSPIYRNLQKAYTQPHRGEGLITFGADDRTTWHAGGRYVMRVFDRFDYGNGENADVPWLDIGWDAYWEVIYRANTLIEGLKTSTANPALIAVADGEARFLRALAYFNLVRTHGNMPILLEDHFPTGEESRATVLENYAHVEEDLLIAIKSLPLPGDVQAPGHASMAAAKTLLADLYLTWAGWPVKDESKLNLAVEQAQDVIELGYFELLPIDQLWEFTNQNSLESVFSIQFSETEQMHNGWPAATNFHESRGWSNMFPELRFFYDFPEGPRKEYTFYTDIPQRAFVDGKIVTKDPPAKPWQESSRAYPMYRKFSISEDLSYGSRTTGFRAFEVFRYAEVLLIFAEAQARLGESAASIDALNQVKRRAMGLPIDEPAPGVDITTALVDEIIDEKGWELAGEQKRWFDLIRTETLESVVEKRDPNEKVPLARQPTKEQYIVPIPQKAISGSKLIQNPEGFAI